MKQDFLRQFNGEYYTFFYEFVHEIKCWQAPQYLITLKSN